MRTLIKIFLLTIFAASLGCAATTRIVDTIRYSDRTLASGRVVITNSAFISSSGNFVAAASYTVNVSNGYFSVYLEPNDAATPAGTSYRVQYQMNNSSRGLLGIASTEYWVVPTSATAKRISEVRVTTIPTPNLTIALSQLNTSGAITGQLLKYDGNSIVWGGASGVFYFVKSGGGILGDSVRFSDSHGLTGTLTGNEFYYTVDSSTWATVSNLLTRLALKSDTSTVGALSRSIAAKSDTGHTHTRLNNLNIAGVPTFESTADFPNGSLLGVNNARQLYNIPGYDGEVLRYDGSNWVSDIGLRTINDLYGDIHMVGAGGAVVSISHDTIYITAGSIDTSGGGSGTVSAIQNTDGTLTVTNPTGPTTTINIASNAIDSTRIATGAVTTTDILNGTINTIDFSATAKPNFAALSDSSVKVDTVAFPIATDAQLTTGLATKANTSHVHTGTDITSGTIPVARVDTSTANVGLATVGDVDRLGTTKANTSHTHAASDVTSGTLGTARIATGTVATNYFPLYTGSAVTWSDLATSTLAALNGLSSFTLSPTITFSVKPLVTGDGFLMASDTTASRVLTPTKAIPTIWEQIATFVDTGGVYVSLTSGNILQARNDSIVSTSYAASMLDTTGTGRRYITFSQVKDTAAALRSASGATTFDGLSDVVVASPAVGAIPKWNGSAWVDTVDATGASAGDTSVVRGEASFSGTATRDTIVELYRNILYAQLTPKVTLKTDTLSIPDSRLTFAVVGDTLFPIRGSGGLSGLTYEYSYQKGTAYSHPAESDTFSLDTTNLRGWWLAQSILHKTTQMDTINWLSDSSGDGYNLAPINVSTYIHSPRWDSTGTYNTIRFQRDGTNAATLAQQGDYLASDSLVRFVHATDPSWTVHMVVKLDSALFQYPDSNDMAFWGFGETGASGGSSGSIIFAGIYAWGDQQTPTWRMNVKTRNDAVTGNTTSILSYGANAESTYLKSEWHVLTWYRTNDTTYFMIDDTVKLAQYNATPGDFYQANTFSLGCVRFDTAQNNYAGYPYTFAMKEAAFYTGTPNRAMIYRNIRKLMAKYPKAGS